MWKAGRKKVEVAKEHETIFQDDGYILVVMMVLKVYIWVKMYQIEYFKWVQSIDCQLNSNKAF